MSRHCCNLVCSLVGVAECMRSEGEDDPRLMRIINSLRPFAVPRGTCTVHVLIMFYMSTAFDTRSIYSVQYSNIFCFYI